MSSYLNGLAPWERKNAYYSVIQLGKDVKAQTKAISKQTKEFVDVQIVSTNEIISSQERISEGIDNVAYGVERVEEGMYGLKAAFEWGISEVVWQIEQHRQVLKGILEVLMAPLDTQAKELRKRAEDAYANGWFEDALEDFLESEKKNKYDFAVHISIGMIYLFQKTDKEKALEYFDKAIKYAKPKSPYHASYALIYKALIKRDFGLIEEAERYTDEAVKLCPDFAEALYQNALYNALLNKPAKAVPLLKKAIEMDINYCEKIHYEKDFDKIRTHIEQMFIELRNEQGENALYCYSILRKKQDTLNDLTNEIRNYWYIEFNDEKIKNILKRIEELNMRNTYRDYLEANTLVNKSHSVIDNLRRDIIGQLEKLIQTHNALISEIRTDSVQKASNAETRFQWIMILGVIISVFLGLRGCWVRGPGAPGGPAPAEEALINAFWALWALIWIPALGIAISYGIYMAVTYGAKSKRSMRRVHG